MLPRLLIPVCAVLLLWPASAAAQLRISEVMPNPNGKDGGNEWIELWNDGTTPEHLRGRRIITTGGARSQLEVVFQEGELAPGQHMQVPLPGSSLTNTEQTIIIYDVYASETLDTVAYTDAVSGSSWALLGGAFAWTNQPTPGAPNQQSIALPDATPNNSAKTSAANTRPANLQDIDRTTRILLSEIYVGDNSDSFVELFAPLAITDIDARSLKVGLCNGESRKNIPQNTLPANGFLSVPVELPAEGGEACLFWKEYVFSRLRYAPADGVASTIRTTAIADDPSGTLARPTPGAPNAAITADAYAAALSAKAAARAAAPAAAAASASVSAPIAAGAGGATVADAQSGGTPSAAAPSAADLAARLKALKASTALLDTDKDGLPDSLEEELGSSPRRWDTDGDGYADGLEYLQGSSLLDVASVPVISTALQVSRVQAYGTGRLIISGTYAPLARLQLRLGALAYSISVRLDGKFTITLLNQRSGTIQASLSLPGSAISLWQQMLSIPAPR